MNRAPRNPAAILVAGFVLVGTTFVASMLAQPASAHGSTQEPASRVYTCRFDTPDNSMCAAAWSANSQALYDWMEVNIGDVGGRHQELIPNGQLCSAGRQKYAAFDRPGEWPVTALRSDGAGLVNLVYQNTAPHSTEYYRVYITREGFDARTDSLAWADLELVHDSGRLDRASQQSLRAALPNRDVPAILYIVWQRSDSPEAFYACSDVTINGGSTSPPTTTAQTPSTSVPTSSVPTTSSPTTPAPSISSTTAPPTTAGPATTNPTTAPGTAPSVTAAATTGTSSTTAPPTTEAVRDSTSPSAGGAATSPGQGSAAPSKVAGSTATTPQRNGAGASTAGEEDDENTPAAAAVQPTGPSGPEATTAGAVAPAGELTDSGSDPAASTSVDDAGLAAQAAPVADSGTSSDSRGPLILVLTGLGLAFLALIGVGWQWSEEIYGLLTSRGLTSSGPISSGHAPGAGLGVEH